MDTQLNHLKIYQEGAFFNAYNYNALILSYIFRYKPYFKNHNIKVGFPVDSIDMVCKHLEALEISYIIIKNISTIKRDYSAENNQYQKYINLVNERLKKFNMTYDEYYEKLKLISQKQNNTSNSFKESSSTNDIKINLCIVEIGDRCKLLFDEDNEPIEITIKQAVPIYSPTWLGNHDQNSRRTTKVEYKSDADHSKGEISSISPLAKAIIGKTKNSKFFYMVDKQKIWVTIIDILKTKKTD